MKNKNDSSNFDYGGHKNKAKEAKNKLKKPVRHVPDDSAGILDLLPIPDMNLIASAGSDGNMCIWAMDTLIGKTIHPGHTKAVVALEWLETNRLILAASLD